MTEAKLIEVQLTNNFSSQVEQHLPRLRGYARALTRNRVHADDLLQTCLARAFAKQALWKPGTDLRAWLFTIMHHSHVNEVRRAMRHRAYAEVSLPLVTTASSDPSVGLDIRDVARAITRLPEHQSRALMLVGVDGFDYTTAATVLGVPTGTVRSRLGRARETLRRELGRELGRPLPPSRRSCSGQALWAAK